MIFREKHPQNVGHIKQQNDRLSCNSSRENVIDGKPVSSENTIKKVLWKRIYQVFASDLIMTRKFLQQKSFKKFLDSLMTNVCLHQIKIKLRRLNS